MSRQIVSVIIPSYNHGIWLSQCIESVQSQTYRDLELIIVDDASTDNSREVIASYLSDVRIHAIFKETNSGQGNSINQALNICSGEFICILPSDDYFLPEKIFKQLTLFNQLPDDYGLVYCNGLRYFEHSKMIRPVLLPKFKGKVLDKLLKYNNFIYPASAMIKRCVFNNLRFDETYRAEGEAIFFKIAEDYKIDYIDESLVVMRDHSFNTGSNTMLMFNENNRYWSAYFNSRRHIELIYSYRGLFLGRINRAYGLSFLNLNLDQNSARKALLLSIRYHPYYFFDPKVISAILLSIIPFSLMRIALRLVPQRINTIKQLNKRVNLSR